MDDVATHSQTIDLIAAIIDSGVMVVIMILMVRGEILPRSIVDLILTEAEKRSKIIVTEILDSIDDKVKHAVKEGVLEGHAEARGRSVGD
jgi:hypothetical protein